jgi:hypothetical protein
VNPMARRIAPPLLLLLVALGACGSTGPATGPELQTTTDAKFAPGQRWKYHTRPGEEDSLVQVLRVESSGKRGTIVHVALTGLHLHGAGGKEVTHADHLPIGRAALDASVVSLVDADTALPDYAEGYRLWKSAFLASKGGFFTVPLAEVVDFLQKGLGAP